MYMYVFIYIYIYIYAWFSILYFSSLLYIGITLTGTRLKKRQSTAGCPGKDYGQHQGLQRS